MTWQPIEAAPVDGTEILLWEGEFETYAVGYFCEAEGRWQVFPGIGTITPSHWMPLPEPPEEE